MRSRRNVISGRGNHEVLATRGTQAVVTKTTLPFTGLDLSFLAGAGAVLVAMGFSLRRLTRKSDIAG